MWSPKFIFCEQSSYIGPKIWKKKWYWHYYTEFLKKCLRRKEVKKKAITNGYFLKNFTKCTIFFNLEKCPLCVTAAKKYIVKKPTSLLLYKYLCTPKTCEISMYFFYSTMFENNVLCIQNTNTYSWRVWQTKHNLLLTQIQKKLCSSGGVIY